MSRIHESKKKQTPSTPRAVAPRKEVDSSMRLVTGKSFDDMLASMGDIGQVALQMEIARQILFDSTIAADRMPDMLYQRLGPGDAMQLPADPGHPSPWMQIANGILVRFTDIQGNLGNNQLDIRIAPNTQVTLDQIINGVDQEAGLGLVGYPIGQPAQNPILEPKLS